ncbi:MAG TPA: hypothetical protein PLJ60_14820, partial [Chryseolinea sp.]|nr:hypothetical protein [Chryseolinea sp.]
SDVFPSAILQHSGSCFKYTSICIVQRNIHILEFEIIQCNNPEDITNDSCVVIGLYRVYNRIFVFPINVSEALLVCFEVQRHCEEASTLSIAIRKLYADVAIPLLWNAKEQVHVLRIFMAQR